MESRHRKTGAGALRSLLSSRRGLQVSGIAIAVLSAGVVAGCGSASLTSAGFSRHPQLPFNSHGVGAQKAKYTFTTIDDPADVTFNQLLGINQRDVIAGYFGSGAANHPNQGYVLNRQRAGYAITNENVPNSVQTQVTGLNNRGVTVGFWADANGANFGFYNVNGRFTNVNFPTNNATPPVNQLLGVNDQFVTVGFYNDAAGNSHGYTFSIFGHRFRPVTVRGATSLTATAINNRNDVAGFFTNAAGATDSFLRTAQGRVTTLAFPAANVSATQALGVNDFREVVGVYTVGTGDAAKTHGFTWAPGRGFKTVDDPLGVGGTTINGVNDAGAIVGFYVDGATNTDGFAATPFGQRPLPGLIAPAPGGSSSPAPTGSGSSSPAPTGSGSSSPAPTGSGSSSPAPTGSGSSSPAPTGGSSSSAPST